MANLVCIYPTPLFEFCFPSPRQVAFYASYFDCLLESTDYFSVNGPRDWGSIPGRVIPKTQKMVLDSALLNTQLNKVRIKSKVESSREWSFALPHIPVW